MITQFKTLFTVSVSHTYYSGNCRDFDFVVPADVARLMSNGRLLARVLEGKLYVLFETTDLGAPRCPLPGKTLRFGLRLTNAAFTNYTVVDSDFGTSRLLYKNKASPTALDTPSKTALVGNVFVHQLTDTARPVTITLRDENGVALKSDVITSANDRTDISFDLTKYSAGAYTVEEAYTATTKDIPYYFDSELLSQSVVGILEIAIDSGFYTTAPDFAISFSAKQDTLKYYVVTNYPPADIASLSVTDAGGSSPITFTKVFPVSDDISQSITAGGTNNVVLFQSQTAVARNENARPKIQLAYGSEVLIANLPQPGQEKAGSNIIVSISKP